MGVINVMLEIQMDILILVLLFGVGIHSCFMLNKKKQIHRLFSLIIFLTVCMLFLEILNMVLGTSVYPGLQGLGKAVNAAVFALTPGVPMLTVLYAYKMTHKRRQLFLPAFRRLALPFFLNAFFSAGSYYTGWMFIHQPGQLYERGPLFFILPLTCAIYYVVHLLVLYSGRRRIGTGDLLVLSSLTLIPALLTAVQLYWFNCLTIWTSVAVAVVINYIYIIHAVAKRDALTGLGNRLAYDEYMARLRRKRQINLAIVNIDLDDFKQINDRFGHEAGDKVLRFFARQLEDVFFGTGLAIRLGGDEFVVLLSEKRRERVQTHIEKLQERIRHYNETGERSYDLSFSCGIAVFDDTYKSLHEFLHRADALMYEEKKKKKKRG